ncbi:MAG: protein phosphatase 2C domain-containing protein [Candidatus Contendobacter sp.]|nr:protein phosphatase 2C domain-containing protein [Candidatus Contendobacter sp.]
MYRLMAATHARPTRSQACGNQDAHRFGWIGNYPVLVVCDGVSSSPFAARAATLACDVFMDDLAQQLPVHETPLIILLSAAVIQAHRRLLSEYASGQALCTLAAAVACPDSQNVCFVNVGDAPAYFGQEGKVDLCATLDIRAQARQQNGATVIKDGMPLMDYPLTACLGFPAPFRPHLLVRSVRPGVAVAVGSDGVDQQAIREVFQAGPQIIDQTVFDHLVREAAHRNDDDATLVLLALGEDPELAALSQQLIGYEGLAREQRRALLDRLAQHPQRHQVALAILAQCYRQESEESLKVSWFQWLARRLDRSERIGYADDAAKASHAVLLRHIIDSLNRG